MLSNRGARISRTFLRLLRSSARPWIDPAAYELQVHCPTRFATGPHFCCPYAIKSYIASDLTNVCVRGPEWSSEVHKHQSSGNQCVLYHFSVRRFINYSLKCYQWQPFMFVIAPFYFILCVYVGHIAFLCNFHELYLYLCFILVVFYIVFLYCVSL